MRWTDTNDCKVKLNKNRESVISFEHLTSCAERAYEQVLLWRVAQKELTSKFYFAHVQESVIICTTQMDLSVKIIVPVWKEYKSREI